MKNITLRTSDYRYVGRKQIKGKRIVVYGKTQKECFNNLKLAIQNFNNPIKIEYRNKNKLWNESVNHVSYTIKSTGKI